MKKMPFQFFISLGKNLFGKRVPKLNNGFKANLTCLGNSTTSSAIPGLGLEKGSALEEMQSLPFCSGLLDHRQKKI